MNARQLIAAPLVLLSLVLAGCSTSPKTAGTSDEPMYASQAEDAAEPIVAQDIYYRTYVE
jgi:hypothetical protein